MQKAQFRLTCVAQKRFCLCPPQSLLHYTFSHPVLMNLSVNQPTFQTCYALLQRIAQLHECALRQLKATVFLLLACWLRHLLITTHVIYQLEKNKWFHFEVDSQILIAENLLSSLRFLAWHATVQDGKVQIALVATGKPLASIINTSLH